MNRDNEAPRPMFLPQSRQIQLLNRFLLFSSDIANYLDIIHRCASLPRGPCFAAPKNRVWNARVVRQIHMSNVQTYDQEWNKSQALAHKPRNSSFFRCVSGLSIPGLNGPRWGSGPLPRGGVPISRSYSARPRLRPRPLRLDSPLIRLIGGLPGVAPWFDGGEGGVGGWWPV